MGYLNFTTDIPVSRTVGEIQAMLSEAGAERLMLEYAGKVPMAVRFSLPTQFGTLIYSLPCNIDGVWRRLSQQSGQFRYDRSGRGRRVVPQRLVNKEQAARVGWRVVKDWLEAQLAIIEAGVVTVDQALLPYQEVGDGMTVYDVLLSQGLQLLALPAPTEVRDGA